MAVNTTQPGSAVPVDDAVVPLAQQPAYKVWVRFRRNKMAMISAVFIVLEIFLAIFAQQISPYDPYKGDYTATWQLPSAQHWMGTDDLGRDVATRLLFGARISLSIGIFSQIIICTIEFFSYPTCMMVK